MATHSPCNACERPCWSCQCSTTDTTDLGALRAEVESNLRKVESLVNEINRKWPFARNTELQLP